MLIAPRVALLRISFSISLTVPHQVPSLSTTRFSRIRTMSSQKTKFAHLPLSTTGPQPCALAGTALLNTPYFNKGAAFTSAERREFELTGLLPQNVAGLDRQVKRAYQQYQSRSDDLAKNTFMTSLKGQNEVLYYRVCHACSWWLSEALTADGAGLMRPADPGSSEGDVQYYLYSDGRRCYPEFLKAVSEAGRMFSEYQ
jgi:hypothetical protein